MAKKLAWVSREDRAGRTGRAVVVRQLAAGTRRTGRNPARPGDSGRTKQKRPTENGWALNSGGDEEDRTPDLRIANATLSQLSYAPTRNANSIIVTLESAQTHRARERRTSSCAATARPGSKPSTTTVPGCPGARVRAASGALGRSLGAEPQAIDPRRTGQRLRHGPVGGPRPVPGGACRYTGAGLRAWRLVAQPGQGWLLVRRAGRQRIAIAGHSAGAHLAAMLLCCRWKNGPTSCGYSGRLLRWRSAPCTAWSRFATRRLCGPTCC